jgi:hypothetical protein
MLKYPMNAKQISQDFSGMTNTILTLSDFYKDHEIHTLEKSFFHSVLRDKVQPDANISLVCCVTEQSLPSAEAVEYCHKIRSYFNGNTTVDSSQELEQ